MRRTDWKMAGVRAADGKRQTEHEMLRTRVHATA
jgi:hypothetical protein